MSGVEAIIEFYYRLLATPPIGSIVFFIKVIAFIVVVLAAIGARVFHKRLRRVIDSFHMRLPRDDD